MTFTVKTQHFEGPLDLLLDLIEKRKLFIGDFSLAQVTDDFIEHVRDMGNLPMGESAHFILVASTLLLIKSKSLLPELTLTEEEKGDIHDLEIRLKIYKRIKEASQSVKESFGREVIFTPSNDRPTPVVFAPDPKFDLVLALSNLREIIGRLPKKEVLSKISVKKVISLEEMIENLSKRVMTKLKMSFREFTKEHKENRLNIIVSFLAVLELVKQGSLFVNQEKNFGDIFMETKDVGVPRY